MSRLPRKLRKTCSRTYSLLSNVEDIDFTKNYDNFSKEIDSLTDKGDFYSAASKCFTNNIRLRNKVNENLTITDDLISNLINDIEKFEEDLNDKEIKSVIKVVIVLSICLNQIYCHL